MAPNWYLVNAVPEKYLDGRDMIVCFMPGGRQLVARWDRPTQAWVTTFGAVFPTHVLPTDAAPIEVVPVPPEPAPLPAPEPDVTKSKKR